MVKPIDDARQTAIRDAEHLISFLKDHQIGKAYRQVHVIKRTLRRYVE